MNNDVYFEVELDKTLMRKPSKILDSGQCFGFNYYIISFGSHPCSYVEIPNNHKLYNKKYMDIEDKIEVHGGLTYSCNKLYGVDDTGIKWFIGWDYGHAFDYQLIGRIDGKLIEWEGHRWTLEELRQDVFDVCKQLKEMY